MQTEELLENIKLAVNKVEEVRVEIHASEDRLHEAVVEFESLPNELEVCDENQDEPKV